MFFQPQNPYTHIQNRSVHLFWRNLSLCFNRDPQFQLINNVLQCGGAHSERYRSLWRLGLRWMSCTDLKHNCVWEKPATLICCEAAVKLCRGVNNRWLVHLSGHTDSKWHHFTWLNHTESSSKRDSLVSKLSRLAGWLKVFKLIWLISEINVLV